MSIDNTFSAAAGSSELPASSKALDFDRVLSAVAAVSAALAACAGMIGRILHIEILETPCPIGLAPKPELAWALAATGSALLLAVFVPRARAARSALGAAVSAFGLLSLFQYAFGADFRLDTVLSLSNRPSIPAAASLFGIGLALMSMNARSTALRIVRVAAGVFVIVAAMTAILGYFLLPADTTTIRPWLVFSPPAAAACLLLGLGFLAPGRSFAKVTESVSVAAPILGLAAMSCLVVMTLSVVNDEHNTRMRVRSAMIAHKSLAYLLDLLQDAETGQRGYLLTGEEEYLQPYAAAAPSVASEITQIRALIGNDADGQDRLTRIGSLADGKLAEMRETIGLKRAGDGGSALALVRTGFGERTMI